MAATPTPSTATCTCSSTKARASIVSFNSGGKEGTTSSLRQAIFEEFADRYFPARRPPRSASIDAKAARANAEKLAGTWGSSRRAFSNFVSIADLLGQTQDQRRRRRQA